MKARAFVSTVLLIGVWGCLPALNGGSGSFAAMSTPRNRLASSNGAPGPTVQVRDSWRSADVGIVAWDEDDNDFGLTTAVTRWGALYAGSRRGDHRLYLTPAMAWNNGGFKYATVDGHLLLSNGGKQDPYACFYGKCSPGATSGVRIPDAMLRAHRDSLVVTFHPPVLEPWTITLRAELIAAYLARVDSVVARMKPADVASSGTGAATSNH